MRFISSDGGFYESVNGGATWKVKERFKEGLLQLIADKRVSGKFWVRTSKGTILKTVDGGVNWVNVSENLKEFDGSKNIQDLTFDKGSLFIYSASDFGVLRSFDGNGRWSKIPLLVPSETLPIKSIAIDPKNSNIMYTGAKSQFYKSFDNGNSWNIVQLPTNREVSRIVVDPLDSDIIYVGLE